MYPPTLSACWSPSSFEILQLHYSLFIFFVFQSSFSNSIFVFQFDYYYFFLFPAAPKLQLGGGWRGDFGTNSDTPPRITVSQISPSQCRAHTTNVLCFLVTPPRCLQNALPALPGYLQTAFKTL